MQKYYDSVLNRRGQAIEGAIVTVTNVDGSPAAIYADNETTQLTQPLRTNGDGEFSFKAKNGRYVVHVNKGDTREARDTRLITLFDADDDTGVKFARKAVDDPEGALKDLGGLYAPGGKTGQILRKNSNEDGDAGWGDPGAAADAIDVREFGIVPNAGHEQTEKYIYAAQVAAEEGLWLIWPDGEFLVDAVTEFVSGRRGLAIPSNSMWRMSPGTVLKAVPTESPRYEIINLHGAQDVLIRGNGARIIGERKEHLGTGGEWGMGVSLRGANNIKIYDMSADDCWGDGWYIGALSGGQRHCDGVWLVRTAADNNRRQGCSWVSGKNIHIIKPRWTNTNGTDPQAGCDIEPNAPDEFIQGRIVDPYTSGNASSGIMVFLETYDGSKNAVDIVIDNHHDDGSWRGASAHGFGSAKGNVVFNRPLWENGRAEGFMARNYSASMPRVELNKPTVLDCAQNASGDPAVDSAFVVKKDNLPNLDDVGSISIIKPTVSVRGVVLPQHVFFYRNSSAAGELRKVEIIDPLEVRFSATEPLRLDGQVIVSDRYGALTLDSVASHSIKPGRLYRTYTNKGATGAVKFDLPDGVDGGPLLTFLIVEPHTVIISVGIENPALRIYPTGATANMSCSQIGARLTLQRRAGGYWIVECIGDWQAV